MGDRFIGGRGFLLLAALALGCSQRELSDNDAAGTSAAGTTQGDGSGPATTDDADGTVTATATGVGTGSETGTPTSVCDDAPDFVAVATVIDEGLGPESAPVTITNCTDTPAYVQQDCCFGAAFFLERKDTPDGPWHMSLPGVACDCKGPIDPLEIPPQSSIVIDTNPAAYDSEPICQEPYVAYYRWTFFVGTVPDCTDCWIAVPTNDMTWYCEG